MTNLCCRFFVFVCIHIFFIFAAGGNEVTECKKSLVQPASKTAYVEVILPPPPIPFKVPRAISVSGTGLGDWTCVDGYHN